MRLSSVLLFSLAHIRRVRWRTGGWDILQQQLALASQWPCRALCAITLVFICHFLAIYHFASAEDLVIFRCEQAIKIRADTCGGEFFKDTVDTRDIMRRHYLPVYLK